MRIIKEPDVRKREILEAAVRVFARKGYESASICDIAREAGISQGLCYRYFPTKEALYDEAIETYAGHIVSRSLAASQDVSIRDQLLRRCGRFDLLAALEDEDAALHALFHQNRKLHDRLALRVAQMTAPHVAALLEDAVRSGEIAAKDPQLLAYLLVFGQLGLFLSGEDIPPKRIQDAVFDLLNLK